MNLKNIVHASVVGTTLLLSSFLITSCKEKTNTALVNNTAPITEKENQELYLLFLWEMMLQEQMGNHSGELKIQCLELNDSIIVTKTIEDGVPNIKIRRERNVMSSGNYAATLRGYLELRRSMAREMYSVQKKQ